MIQALGTISLRPTAGQTMRLTIMASAIAAVSVLTAPASAQQLTGTLAKIKDTGTITLGHRESSVPFSYYDDNQKVIGYAMDLCYKIVDAVKSELKLDKLDVQLNPVTSATRIPLIANGTVDLECGSTTNNLEREKQVAFTITHFVTANRFVSKKSANLKTVDDLKGKTIVSTSGTTNIKQITEIGAQKHLDFNIIAAKDHAEAFLMVETDRAYRNHATPQRCAVQDRGRCRNDEHLQERRDQCHLRQVVPQADTAQGRQPQRTDERAVQEGHRQSDRYRRPRVVRSVSAVRRGC